jgi:hypothetical protein
LADVAAAVALIVAALSPANAQSGMIEVTDFAGRTVKVKQGTERVILGEGRLMYATASATCARTAWRASTGGACAGLRSATACGLLLPGDSRCRPDALEQDSQSDMARVNSLFDPRVIANRVFRERKQQATMTLNIMSSATMRDQIADRRQKS